MGRSEASAGAVRLPGEKKKSRPKGSNTATVRVPREAKEELEKTSEELGIPQSRVVIFALKELRKKMFLQTLCDDFARLRADEKASAEYDEEFKSWDATLSDGLGDE